MISSNKNVLIFTKGMDCGGTEKVILQLCKIISPVVKSVTVCSAGGVNVNELKKMRIEHILIPDIEKKDLLTFIKTIIVLRKIIITKKINIIHTHHRTAAFYTQILSLVHLDNQAKKVFTMHYMFRDKKYLTKFSLKNTRITVVSKGLKDCLIKVYNINDKCINIINNSIEFSAYDKEPVQKHAVAIIGRISEEKGVDIFVKSIAIVKDKIKDIKGYIVGDGPQKEYIKNMIKRMRLDQNIELLGYRKDVGEIIKNVSFLIMCSHGEGLPLTPLEGFSYGRTIVATNVSGICEIVQDGYNGLLVKDNSPEDTAKAIIMLIKDDDLRKRLESNAKKTIAKRFSFETMKRKYENFYNSLI